MGNVSTPARGRVTAVDPGALPLSPPGVADGSSNDPSQEAPAVPMGVIVSAATSLPALPGNAPAIRWDAAVRTASENERQSVVPSPAAQAGSVLLSLASRPDGVQALALRLDPGELGVVNILVERHSGGPAVVTLTADRPETLALLMRDQPDLHRALDQAGIPLEGRQLAFHLTPADVGPAPQPSVHHSGGDGTASGNGAAFGNSGSDQSRAQGRPSSRRRPPLGLETHGEHLDPDRAWHRLGINITA